MTGRGHQDIFADDITWRDGSGPGVKYARFVTDELVAAEKGVQK